MTEYFTALAQFCIISLSRTTFAVTGFGEGIIYQLAFHTCSAILPNICSGKLTAALVNLTLEGLLSLSLQVVIYKF